MNYEKQSNFKNNFYSFLSVGSSILGAVFSVEYANYYADTLGFLSKFWLLLIFAIILISIGVCISTRDSS